MSRIGNSPIQLPKNVEIRLDAGGAVNVKGPKGTLSMKVHPDLKLDLADGVLRVVRPSDESRHKALHGLTRTLLANMVSGVTDGFSKKLEIQGVGYRAEKKPHGLTLHLGYSHPVNYAAPTGIEFEVPVQTEVVVKGVDKALVGQVAAEIRGIRPPEPYKGKGVRYSGEQVRRKAGKTAGS
jgi:large subunit ribosomal protein L6